MKANRLVLCLFLSLALIATYIPIISFADDGNKERSIEYGTIELDDNWKQSEDDPTYWTNDSYGATITFSGTGFTETEHGFSAEVGKTVYMYIYPASRHPVDRVYHNDNLLEHDGETGLYCLCSFNVCEDFVDGDVWNPGNSIDIYFEEMESITFIPKGQHYVWRACDSELNSWDEPSFQEKDQLIIKYSDKTSIYTYTEEGWRDNNYNAPYLDYCYMYGESVSASAHKSGDVSTMKVTVVVDGVTTEATISVMFLLDHVQYYNEATDTYYSDLKATAATPATCTAPGNSEYWTCPLCKRYFSDKFGQKEIASGAWVIPATGHKFDQTKVTKKAGLLKNGTQVQMCSVCGAYGKTSVVPGWGVYYVKTPKTTAGKKSFTVKWKKQSKANLKKFNGYQIRYSMKKNMAKAKTVKVKKTATSKTIKKLKEKTKYYVQVRTYTKKSGKLFYSKWSAKKTVKTK